MSVKFYNGKMKTGKSLLAIALGTEAQHCNRTVLFCKPRVDTRDGNKISSRIGLNIECQVFEDVVEDMIKFDVIIIDECQFLTKEQVDYIFKQSILYPKIDFYCFGLLTDFTLSMFEGSKRLIELNAELFEIPTTTPEKCVNALFINGEIATEGSNIAIESENHEYRVLTLAEYYDEIEKKEKK